MIGSVCLQVEEAAASLCERRIDSEAWPDPAQTTIYHSLPKLTPLTGECELVPRIDEPPPRRAAAATAMDLNPRG